MKRTEQKRLTVFGGALALGVLLHFLYDWTGSALVSPFSPVRESLWEHVKIVFWPLLLAGAVLSGSEKRTAAAWRLSAVITSMLMLLAAYVYHILLGGDWLVFDLVLYAVSIVAGFLLPRLLWPGTESAVVRGLAAVLCIALAAALTWWSFRVPEGILFEDLTHGVQTFLTIPV